MKQIADDVLFDSGAQALDAYAREFETFVPGSQAIAVDAGLLYSCLAKLISLRDAKNVAKVLGYDVHHEINMKIRETSTDAAWNDDIRTKMFEVHISTIDLLIEGGLGDQVNIRPTAHFLRLIASGLRTYMQSRRAS